MSDDERDAGAVDAERVKLASRIAFVMQRIIETVPPSSPADELSLLSLADHASELAGKLAVLLGRADAPLWGGERGASEPEIGKAHRDYGGGGFGHWRAAWQAAEAFHGIGHAAESASAPAASPSDQEAYSLLVGLGDAFASHGEEWDWHTCARWMQKIRAWQYGRTRKGLYGESAIEDEPLAASRDRHGYLTDEEITKQREGHAENVPGPRHTQPAAPVADPPSDTLCHGGVRHYYGANGECSVCGRKPPTPPDYPSAQRRAMLLNQMTYLGAGWTDDAYVCSSKVLNLTLGELRALLAGAGGGR